MAEQEVANPQIIGLTGSFGSGCTYIAKNILQPKPNEYKFLSLSDLLKQKYEEDTGNNPENATRKDLQDFGDNIREKNGPGYFANQAVDRIQTDRNNSGKWVIDSIKNPSEILVLREYSRNFFLFGIYANQDKSV